LARYSGAAGSGGIGEAVKVPAPAILRGAEYVLAQEVIEKSLTQPGEFAKAASVFGIVQRQIEEL